MWFGIFMNVHMLAYRMINNFGTLTYSNLQPLSSTVLCLKIHNLPTIKRDFIPCVTEMCRVFHVLRL